MTRSEALTIITNALQAVDDATLEAAAAHIAHHANPTGVTVGDIQEAFVTDSILPRELSARELALIAQSKEDFRLGRTRTHDESVAYVTAELERRLRSST